MIRAMIVDDEQHARENLEHKLQSYCEAVDETYSADSAAAAIGLIRKRPPDLLFLDVSMPGGSGFELLEALGPERDSFEVVFVTAHAQHAISAIKHEALDYLLKPVSPLELQNAVKKCLQRRRDTRREDPKSADMTVTRLSVPSEYGFEYIPVKNIIHCRAERNYSRVHTVDGAELVTARTLGEIEEQLSPETFFRVHHSHLINLQHIRKYFKGRGGTVEMSDGTQIQVSARRRDAFLERMHGSATN